MSHQPLPLLTPSVDAQFAGVLIANMLEAWLTAAPALEATEEAMNDHQDHRTALQQTGVHLYPSVDSGPGTASSGEYRTPVCAAGQSVGTGWPETAIRTLDRDLGQSGARMKGREDFKTLVADVSMGQAGAVFALEVSRQARSNLDWHRLLELCALTHTLVIDADGCYDPGDFNDGLLLGLKGTMAQAKLHFLRGRLQGGKLNKAQKGELRFP